jgi:hypothetical protein
VQNLSLATRASNDCVAIERCNNLVGIAVVTTRGYQTLPDAAVIGCYMCSGRPVIEKQLRRAMAMLLQYMPDRGEGTFSMKKTENRKNRNLVLNRQVIRELAKTELHVAGGYRLTGDPAACATIESSCCTDSRN